MHLRIVPDRLDGDEAFSVFCDGAYFGRVAPADLPRKVANLSTRATLGDLGLVSKADVAQCFGVHARTVNNWMALGMPHERQGRQRVFFNLGDCRAWLRHKGLLRPEDKANA